MKKLNSTIYNKLLLQAEEAEEKNMKKLSSAVKKALTAYPEDEEQEYSIQNLNNDVYNGLWNVATCVLKYYNLESADIEKINSTVELISKAFVKDLEKSLEIPQNTVGPLEPKVFGQK